MATRKRAFDSKSSVTEADGTGISPQQQVGIVTGWGVRQSSFGLIIIGITLINSVVVLALVSLQSDACRGDPNATRNVAMLVGAIVTSLTGAWIAVTRRRRRT